MSKPAGHESVRSWCGAALLALGLSSCLPVVIPPARVDVGFGPYTSTRSASAARATGADAVKAPSPLAGNGVLRVAAGLHLASLLPSATLPVDVGVGYVLGQFPGDDGRAVHGAYGEISPIVLRGPSWRATVGARGELLLARSSRLDDGHGLFGRVGVEVFRSVRGMGSTSSGAAVGGATMGMLAAGLFLEAGAQRLPGGDVTHVGVLGVSIRTPATLGVICCLRR